jgi:glycolate oxidase FAD binding subunit
MSNSDQLDLFQETVRAAAAAGDSLRIRGAGSKDFLGEAGRATRVLDTSGHCGVLQYEPTELVLTARAGTSMLEIEQALANERQMLGFEPPYFGQATLGGTVCTALSGPRRVPVAILS